jgi:hypothetical protein
MSTSASVRDTFENFRRIKREINAADADEHERLVREGVVLGVGILLGGGFPGSAAAVTTLVETCFPDSEWPWDGSAAE